ncbi:MAG: thermonuclease family protein [Bryobacteraceae bacterium]
MICIIATVALVLALPFPALAESFEGRVVAITDGDTIRILRDGEQVRVRLHGIDAPEKKQAFGTRARQYAGELAHGKLVRVEVKDMDRNGRTVGVVFLPDGRNLNHELVRTGFAWWFDNTLGMIESWRGWNRKPETKSAVYGLMPRRSLRGSFVGHGFVIRVHKVENQS